MAENKELKYNEPWILQRADPFVCKKDGWYYFTASVPAYDSIVLRRAKKLADLPQAEEVVIWKKHESGPMSKHIWAPELHYLEGNLENPSICAGMSGAGPIGRCMGGKRQNAACRWG